MKKTFFMIFSFSFLFLLAGCNTTPPTTNISSGVAQTQIEKLPEPTMVNGEKQYINDNIYLYYYGQTCSHCKKVEDYLKDSGVDQWIHITANEVQMDRDHQQELLHWAETLNVPVSEVGTPFVVVEMPDGNNIPLIGEEEVINHFKQLAEEIRALQNS